MGEVKATESSAPSWEEMAVQLWEAVENAQTASEKLPFLSRAPPLFYKVIDLSYSVEDDADITWCRLMVQTRLR